MTARRAFLSNFWAGTKGGLLTTKHIAKMGMARWLFDYLTLNQTSVNQHGVGVVYYGHPIKLEQIAFDMSEGKPMPVRTIQKWLNVLRREGYISTESHSKNGLVVWIMKAKDKTKKPRTVTPESPRKVSTKSDTSGDTIPYTNRVANPRDSIHETGKESVHSLHVLVKESPQAAETATVAVPIPEGFTSESPSYHNKDAAAPSISSLIEKSRGEKQHRKPSLQEQIQEIKRRGLWVEAPSKVMELPRKEASA